MAREIQIPVAVARLLPDLIAVAAREDFPVCAEIVLRDAECGDVPLARIRKGRPLAPSVPRVWVIQRPEHDDEPDAMVEAPIEFADVAAPPRDRTGGLAQTDEQEAWCQPDEPNNPDHARRSEREA